MRNIEIRTTQNVVIDYELAGAGLRILAFLIDYFILSGFIVTFNIVFAIFFTNFESTTLQYLFYVVIIIIVCFYTLIFEMWLRGQTIGKKILGIKVVRTDGAELTFRDFFTRWSLRLVDIYMSIGTLAILTINGSVLGQRVGDMAANTTVVRTRNSQGFNLNQILSLQTKENYSPVFPLVRNLKEEDVLLIKNVLTRQQTYSNSYYEETTQRLFDKVLPVLKTDYDATQLSLQQKVNILKQVVNDYIVMTR
jgi:uncharacterized RDD family membrane protein YckC